jgi:hypothetical protein
MLNSYNRIEYQSSAITSFDAARIVRSSPEIGNLLICGTHRRHAAVPLDCSILQHIASTPAWISTICIKAQCNRSSITRHRVGSI